MNVQLSLAYFNDKDFEKACELLSSKGFNFDVPIDATQFSTFKFYSEIDGQQIVTLRQDKMKELFDSLNFNVEINNYYETDKILEQLIKTQKGVTKTQKGVDKNAYRRYNTTVNKKTPSGAAKSPAGWRKKHEKDQN